MKTLRLRIGLIWLCYLIAGIGWATDLIKYELTMWVVVICCFASVALRWLKPAFPRRTFTKLQAWIVVPLIVLLICLNHLLVDPTRHQVIFAVFCVVVAVSLVVQAYEDRKVWTSGVDVVA
jgi:hypothetical protein